ncbi:dihydroorotase [Niveispirillum cyanobacteriorum]|uniref:Dihydroorotase n=1 Tax=Niveispirillum cyanobacteriorum TaxID=1612173 RepID=A0A2K9N8F4_9PROT|nr:dihydroorotase [Niveispirillum cyanobacteriorum]AUN29431.1 dihydroorotase [Niveispirillum cyanobacteriorum]GGE64133.1 dihydroorotase [Niveispirillum cyanobacteriorum]
MTQPVLYRNARLIDPASGLDQVGDLLTMGGKIAAIGADAARDLPAGAEIVDATGLVLAPGLVDLRAQVGEPGLEHNETIQTASRSAAAGGITALAALPNTDPVIDDEAGLEFIARRARETKLVKIFAYGTVTRETAGKEISEIGLLAEAGAVGFTDGGPIADPALMRRALSYANGFGQTIFQHPSEPRLAGGVMNAGEIATRLGLAGIPGMAEVIMLERDLRLVEMTGGRYHAANISTAESVAVIRRAKARGLKVTCDTAPPYFALTEVDVGDYRTFFKLSPPLRGEMDRRAIIEGLADGTIDAIASDHHPHDQDSKRVPFAQAAFGAVGLETLLPLTLELVHKGAMSLSRALAAVTSIPANILGLRHLGRLSVGGPADLVLFDLDRPWRVEAEKLASKSKNSCFDRRPVQGMVLRTIVDGRTVFARD